MSEPWIKVRSNLATCPKVVQMARALSVRRSAVIGSCVMLWSLADAHASGDILPGYSYEYLNEYLELPGFCEAAQVVAWIAQVPDGVRLPGYMKHNGATAKRRAQSARRASRSRSAAHVTKSAPEERRGEENKKKKKKEAPPLRVPIAWTTSGWVGITDGDLATWAKAFPACDLARQLAAMDSWLQANPKKATKSNWGRFVVNWLAREQQRGGDTRSNPVGPKTHRGGPDRIAAAEARRDHERAGEFASTTLRGREVIGGTGSPATGGNGHA